MKLDQVLGGLGFAVLYLYAEIAMTVLVYLHCGLNSDWLWYKPCMLYRL